MFQRILKLPERRSFFLFGARGTGKSTLLKAFAEGNSTYLLDLLDPGLEARLLRRPAEITEILAHLSPDIRWVIVDEVQKVPEVLSEVHRQIEKNKNRFFALTGSSARKLKRGKANLLAGRAFVYHLYPFCIEELKEKFDLEEALSFGTLPEVFSLKTDDEKKKYLRAYVHTYLKEEIQMEGIVRNLPSFHRFLPLAAMENGNLLSWARFAADVGIDAKTIRSYFEILEDTLVGFLLPAYSHSLRKRQSTHPKFYFFDTGVRRALSNELNTDLIPGTSEYGRAFEHFWITEIYRKNSYREADYRFSYLATHDMEIDLVVERPGKPLLFVEFKSSENVRSADLRNLQSLVSEVKKSEALCVTREPRKRKVNNVLVCPWQDALKEIGLS